MRIASAFAAWLLCSANVSAQVDGATVAVAVGVVNMESRTELAFSAASGYQFNRMIGLEVEVTAVPTLKSVFPTNSGDQVVIQNGGVIWSSASATAVFPRPAYSNVNGRVVIFTNNVRVELPTATSTLTPYFVAGGGIANVRRTADLTFPIAIGPPTAPIPIPLPPIRITTEHLTSSTIDLALTIGGGVAIRIAEHVSIDGDLRFFRWLGNQDRSVGRFGVGARYRF